jgi:PTS system nitrogen regulatory IIA component
MAPVTMTSLIAPARVIPTLRVRDFPQFVSEMTRIAAAAASLDRAAAQEAVLARAETSSFALGRGVALPHGMIAGLRGPLGAFACLNPALDLDAPDVILVDLVLLILSPEGDEATLLRALACAARRLRDRDVAARIRSADGAEAIHAVLTSDAWRGTASGPDALPRTYPPRQTATMI